MRPIWYRSNCQIIIMTVRRIICYGCDFKSFTKLQIVQSNNCFFIGLPLKRIIQLILFYLQEGHVVEGLCVKPCTVTTALQRAGRYYCWTVSYLYLQNKTSFKNKDFFFRREMFQLLCQYLKKIISCPFRYMYFL